MLSNLEIALLISSVCWSIQHVFTVLPRERIIKLTNEICYSYSRITFNTLWYTTNIILHTIIFYQEDEVLYHGTGLYIAGSLRFISIYVLFLCLFVAPSQFDISSQRDHNRRNLQETSLDIVSSEMIHIEPSSPKTCCSTSTSGYNLPTESDQVPVYGLSHITRHPMLQGFMLYFVSFILNNVRIADLFFYIPQIIQIIFGIMHQEYRMKQDERYNYYFQHTSIFPFIAMIQRRTIMHINDIKRILLSLIIITVLFLIIITILIVFLGPNWIISEFDNHLPGGFIVFGYIIFLIIVDVISICTGRYYRAT